MTITILINFGLSQTFLKLRERVSLNCPLSFHSMNLSATLLATIDKPFLCNYLPFAITIDIKRKNPQTEGSRRGPKKYNGFEQIVWRPGSLSFSRASDKIFCKPLHLTLPRDPSNPTIYSPMAFFSGQRPSTIRGPDI